MVSAHTPVAFTTLAARTATSRPVTRSTQRALEQRLAHEPQVEVLEVAEAAVHELGGAAGGARRVVVALDERDAIPARGGVERDPGAGDPPSDDHEVELLRLQRGEGVVAGD